MVRPVPAMSTSRRPSAGSDRRLATSTLAAYAAPAFAFAVPTIPVYVYLPSVYADDLGLGLAVTGAAILVSRILDTLSDPVVGLISDRTRSRFGRRKPFVVGGALVALIGFLMVAFPPAMVSGVYLTVWLLVLYFGWTCFMVPYTAWGAELSPAYDERTRITSAREGAGLAGIVIASVLPTLAANSGPQALKLMALVAVAAGVVGIALLVRCVPDRSSLGPDEKANGLAALVRDVGQNGPFLRLIAAWFANGLANGLPAALFILFLTHGLGADAQLQPLFILIYFLAAVVALPGWYWLSLKWGKHRAWCLAMIAACAAFAVVPLLSAGDFAAFFAICAVTGAALGADLVLPPALQADVVDLDRLRHGRERAGVYFSLWSATSKSAMALAGGLGLVGVGIAGFDPALPTVAGITALTIAYSVVPIGLKSVAIALLWHYPLNPRRHAIIARRLAGRTY